MNASIERGDREKENYKRWFSLKVVTLQHLRKTIQIFVFYSEKYR